MADAQAQAGGAQSPVISTIAGAAVVVIILALTGVIWNQHNDLRDAVKTLALVSAKCAKK